MKILRDVLTSAGCFLLGFGVATIAIQLLLGSLTPQQRPVETAEPPLAVAQPESLTALGDVDAALLSRLRPHMQALIQSELKTVADDLDKTDKLGAPVGGFGSLLGAAIVSLVKKAIAAALVSMLLSALLALLWAYWYYPAAVAAVWLLLTGLVSAVVAKLVSRKGKP